MRTLILAVASLLPFVVSAQSTKDDDYIRHAAETIATLHDSMLDPASFVLDGAYVTKPIHRLADKEDKDKPTYCYAFRSHNTMGGYAEGRAYEDPLDHGRLQIIHPSADGVFMGYDTGWVAPCKSKNIDRDITAQVAQLAATMYKKTR
jgi:hypothetical protein